MKIVITQPVAPNSAAAPFDVRQIKKSLNRLGIISRPKISALLIFLIQLYLQPLKHFKNQWGCP